MKKTDKLRVLTWHVHGNYLYYLSQTDCVFYLPVSKPARSGFFGKTPQFPWGDNVIEVPVEKIKDLDFDCILFQSSGNSSNPPYTFFDEQLATLSPRQIHDIPKLFLEHEPPRHNPTDTRHILYNAPIPLIHVTAFNRLMWDSGNTPTTVIDHGVTIPRQNGENRKLKKGVVVINNIKTRGRRLGFDIFEQIRKEIPLDLIGNGSEVVGGLGEVPPYDLPGILSQYRFFFHPARYTSLGLAVIEAMMIGLPIVGLTTTELPTVIRNDKEGYIDTDIQKLMQYMKKLLDNKRLAQRLGKQARKTALRRFNINRFSAEWKACIEGAIYQQRKENDSIQRTPIYNSSKTEQYMSKIIKQLSL